MAGHVVLAQIGPNINGWQPQRRRDDLRRLQRADERAGDDRGHATVNERGPELGGLPPPQGIERAVRVVRARHLRRALAMPHDEQLHMTLQASSLPPWYQGGE